MTNAGRNCLKEDRCILAHGVSSFHPGFLPPFLSGPVARQGIMVEVGGESKLLI